MRHIAEGLINDTVKNLGSKFVLDLISKMDLSIEQEQLLYKQCQEANMIEALQELSRRPSIISIFHFLGDYFIERQQDGKFSYLPLPFFNSIGKNFLEVVTILTPGGKVSRGVYKRFGQMTKEYGVQFLNNIYILLETYKENPQNIDHLLNLDHSQFLSSSVLENSYVLSPLLKHYSLTRIFTLFASNTSDQLEDIGRMYKLIPQKKDFISYLPRKPKSFTEIHDAVSFETRKINVKNQLLNQYVTPLHGKTLIDYTIDVPHDAHDLIHTSFVLRHCVHSYVTSVVNRHCQIVNLIKNGKKTYTVEIRSVGPTFFIHQFRGLCNERSMEGEAGISYRVGLLKLLHELPRTGIKDQKS